MNKNKSLLVIIGILLVILVWNQFIASDDNRNFKEVLVALDTAIVTKINITPKNNEHELITFSKENNVWKVSNGSVNDEANQGNVRAMLSAMVELKPERLVAKNDAKWNQYEVSDSLGSNVQFYNGEELIADIMIGKFSFEQNTRVMSTFVRLSNDDDTYAVEGMLSSSFNQKFNNFRDGSFMKFNKNDVTSLRFDYPGDSSFVLNKIDTKWNMNGLEVDSTTVEKYLNGIRNLTQREFADDFSKDGKLATYQLTIDGNNMSPIEVNIFKEDEALTLHSSQNENSYFKPGSLKVYEKLLISSKSLTSTE